MVDVTAVPPVTSCCYFTFNFRKPSLSRKHKTTRVTINRKSILNQQMLHITKFSSSTHFRERTLHAKMDPCCLLNTAYLHANPHSCCFAWSTSVWPILSNLFWENARSPHFEIHNTNHRKSVRCRFTVRFYLTFLTSKYIFSPSSYGYVCKGEKEEHSMENWVRPTSSNQVNLWPLFVITGENNVSMHLPRKSLIGV